MTPEERDLRRALDARSGEVSPEFRVRLGATFNEGRPASGLMQGVAVVAVVAITLGTVGALVMSRNARNVAHQGVVSGSRLASPTASTTTLPEGSSVRLYAPSGTTVWALVGNTVLFRSTDRANTWEQRSLPPSIPDAWFELSFIDDRQGWMFRGVTPNRCADSGAELWHTADGAATWQKGAIGMWTLSKKSDNIGGPDRCMQGLSFVDPKHGFISAAAEGRHPTIYLTRDGGKNWTGIDLADPPDYKTELQYSLHPEAVRKFGNTLYVIARGSQFIDPDRSYVFRSTDGGATWSLMTKIPPTFRVVMVSESRWLQLFSPGMSMESTTSGQQWHPYESDFNAGAGNLVFGDSQVGYAVPQGALLRTFDGGRHWERISAPGLPRLDLLPITNPGFECRLPVGANPFAGGFVPIPRGSFERDQAAELVTVRGQHWSVETVAQPVLKSTGGLSYDAAFSRWVPAGAEVLSTDGSQYAWAEQEAASDYVSGARTAWTPRLHLTTVADGTERSFAIGPPPGGENHGPMLPVPLGITKDGVLLTYGWEGIWGVWRLDLATGSQTKLTGLPSPRYGAGAIWVTPQRGPNRVGMYSDGDTLARLDPKTGAPQDWYHRDNVAVYPLGFDLDGNPWVHAITFGTTPKVIEIWRVRGPGQADLILSNQRISRVTTDSHGTWFANETGVYLYSSGRVQRVSSASVGEVVGPCI